MTMVGMCLRFHFISSCTLYFAPTLSISKNVPPQKRKKRHGKFLAHNWNSQVNNAISMMPGCENTLKNYRTSFLQVFWLGYSTLNINL